MKFYRRIILFSVILFSIIACVPAEEKAEKYYEQGREVFYTNDPERALKIYEKGLEYMPDHYRLLYESGNCYMNFRDYQTAIKFYTKAIESNPNYAKAYANRGQCWFYLNDRDKSCANWMKADSLGMPSMSDKIKHCK